MERLIKICGMRESANIAEVAELKPNLMGFIFYPKSKRFVGENFDASLTQNLLPEIKPVGVFVNETTEVILAKAQTYKLAYIQLHGHEPASQCREILAKGFNVIKAFGVHQGFNWSSLKEYEDACGYFLFDTSTEGYGGSGEKFNWGTLGNYTLSRPFLLSGGIGPNDAEEIRSLNHAKLAGVDINSRFETAPALKDVSLIQTFIKNLQPK